MALRRFMKSFAWLLCRVVGLFTPREKPLQQAAGDFHLACSLDTSKILEVDTWLTGFKTGFNHLNNSRALIFDRFAMQTGARVRLSPVSHRVSSKWIEWLSKYFQNQVFDFLSVRGVGEDASVSLVTGHRTSYLFLCAAPSVSKQLARWTWNSITVL